MFLSPADFPFTKVLEDNWKAVLGELNALPGMKFSPFFGTNLYAQQNDDGTEEQGKGWATFAFYVFGKNVEENCKACPETTRLVEEVPFMTLATFSRMLPGTHIKPHVGYTSSVLRCHLGLITPPDCALRVGDETKSWMAGKCWVFDDTQEHEAWNRSDGIRTILMIDFAKEGRPLSVAELIKSQK